MNESLSYREIIRRETIPRLQEIKARMLPLRDTFNRLSHDDQKGEIQRCVEDATGNADLANEMLCIQIGPGYANPLENLLKDIPPRKQQETIKKYSEMTKPFWLWTIFKPGNEHLVEDAWEYLKKYRDVAVPYGLYPAEPRLEYVQHQRAVSRPIRTFAAHLRTILSIQSTHNLHIGYGESLVALHDAMQVYGEYEIAEIQTALRRKMNHNVNKISLLDRQGIWNDKEDLITMCTDSGLRNFFLAYSRTFEQLDPEGYRLNQRLSTIGPTLEALRKAPWLVIENWDDDEEV